MFQAFKEIADSVRETGFDLAAKAVTGFMSLYREVAAHVEEQTGFALPLAGQRTSRSLDACGGFSSEPFRPDDGVKTGKPVEADNETPKKAMADLSSGPKTKAGDEKDKETKKTKAVKGPATKPKGAAKKPSEKRTMKKRVTKKRATNKSGAGKTQKKQGRKNQLARVLELLNEDGASWKSATELAEGSAKQGTRILPGNVRKVIRMRGEKYIETRPRASSRRGSLEYHITPAGLKYLQESEKK